MGNEVKTMSERLAMLAAGEQPGVSVTDVCTELGISRQTYYRLRRRVAEEGPSGIEPRSRRPHHSPRAIPAWLEDEIVRLRKELPLDNGAQSIRYHLERAGLPTPSLSTIHRALTRRGMVVPEPAKRPKVTLKRFEFEAPNACWQIDATFWPLAGGISGWIMDIVDDHSRLAVAARVGTGPTAALAWEAFCAGAREWGLPQRVLSDNGSCFTGRNRGTADFERNLRALGITPITSSPAHPQTCGKIERFHKTLKGWLGREPLAKSHHELQAQLDRFLDHYNRRRPHRALSGATPAERFDASAPAGPRLVEVEQPRPAFVAISTVAVNCNGVIEVGKRHQASIGKEWAGRRVTLVRYGLRTAVLDGTTLISAFTVDPTRRYQRSGRSPQRRPKRQT
jgi:transposase InsO family protein